MPEVNLENLIRQLKEEGVEKADHEAAQIIARAKSEAGEIVSQAQSRAKELIDKAVQENEKLKQSAAADIKQAGRDTVLLVKQELIKIATRAFEQNVSLALTPEAMRDVILKIAANWAPDKALEVSVSKNDQAVLAGLLPAAFKASGREIEIKTDANLNKGFRISLKGDGVNYDFSEEAVLASIKELLGPALKDILSHG